MSASGNGAALRVTRVGFGDAVEEIPTQNRAARCL
jgi:hypothetical protein